MDGKEVNERVSLTVTESGGDRSIDSGVGHDLSWSLSLDLENSITTDSQVLHCDPQSKIINRVQRLTSCWDDIECEFTGVLERLDDIMVQVKEAGKETDKMIVRNHKKADTLNSYLDDLSTVINDPVAPVAPQSERDVSQREVTSCWENKQVQSTPEIETKVTAHRTSMPSLPPITAKVTASRNSMSYLPPITAKDTASRTSMSSLPPITVKNNIGCKTNTPKDSATTMDIQKMLLAANEQIQSPSFYETRVKVPVNKVNLAIDEKSVAPKATKKKGKSKSTESETGLPPLSKQDLQKPEGFKTKSCTDKLTKDVLPPITRLNHNEKYMQATEQMFSSLNDNQKLSKKRMPYTGAVDCVQKEEKKVPRTTLDFCEARITRSSCQKSAELPPLSRVPPINKRLGEALGGFSGGRQPLTPITPKLGLLPDIHVNSRFCKDDRAVYHHGTPAGSDTCSVSLMDISPRTQVPSLPILESNTALAAPNAPFVLPKILKPKQEQRRTEVPQLPLITQNLPVIMPNRIQPKKQDTMPDRFVTWWPKNAGSLRAQKLESAEGNSGKCNTQKKSLLPLLPNKQNASQFFRKQNKNTVHHRYF